MGNNTNNIATLEAHTTVLQPLTANGSRRLVAIRLVLIAPYIGRDSRPVAPNRHLRRCAAIDTDGEFVREVPLRRVG